MDYTTHAPEVWFAEFRRVASAAGLNVSEDDHEFWLMITNSLHPALGLVWVRLEHDGDGVPEAVSLYGAGMAKPWEPMSAESAIALMHEMANVR